MWNTPHRLEIAEYVAVAGSVIGSVAAAISGKVVFAAVPLTLSVSLNLLNRYRSDQLSLRRTTAAIARLQQQVSEEIESLHARAPALSGHSPPAEGAGMASGAQIQSAASPQQGPDLEPLYQNIAGLQEQCATVQESVSSVIHYLNSSSVVERVDRLEKATAQLSENLAALANQVDAVAQRRWEQKPQPQPAVQIAEPDRLPPAPPAPAAAAPVPAKPVVLPKIVSDSIESWRIARTVTAHSDWVSSLAITSDGQRLVSGSFDKTVKIWRLHTGELLHTLSGHAKGVFSVVTSPGGEILASGSWDETIKLWRISDGTLLDTLTGHTGSVRSVAISPDGQILASGSFDQTIKLWQLTGGIVQSRLTEYSGPIYSVAFSPDGLILASGGGEGAIQLWGVPAREFLCSLTGNLDFVWSLAFSPQGNLLASGNGDGTIKLWQIPSNGQMRYGPSLLGTLAEHSGPVYSAIFSPDGQTLLSGSADGTVRIWDMGSGKLLHTLAEAGKPVISLAISPSGQLLAAGSSAGAVEIWQRD